MNSEPDIFLDYDAAYVLGALDPADRRAYEHHLKTCRPCSMAVSELAGMPGLLAQVPTQQMLAPRTAPESPPDTLLPRMAGELRRERRRRRVWSGIVAAAAAIVLITGTVVTTSALSSDGPSTSASARGPIAGSGSVHGNGTTGGSGAKPMALKAVTSVPITANVSLDSVAWGTRVTLACTYHEYTGSGASSASSAEQDEAKEKLLVYRLVVIPRDGSPPQQVAQWVAVPDTTERLIGSTDLKPAQIQEIQLQDSHGDMLLHVSPTV